MKQSRIPVFDLVRRIGLRLILGRRTYAYMCSTLGQDRRLPRARMADIVVRKDGREVRVEADWLKTLARICMPDLPEPTPQVNSEGLPL